MGMNGAGNQAYYTFDDIGNTSEVTDATGNVKNNYQFLPFGELLVGNEALPNPFTFIGKYGVMESASLYSMRARFYDPRAGRFISQDPLGIGGGSIGLYGYAANNPVSLADPSGERLVWNCGPQPWSSGASHSFGLFIGESHGCDVGISWGASAGFDIGPEVKVGPTAHLGPQIPFLGGAGVASAGAGYGASAGLSCGVSAGGSLGYSYSGGVGWFCGWTWVPDGTPPPQPPNPPGDPGGGGQRPARRPVDPNQKIGPGGAGDQGFIAAGGTLAYRVDFENESKATAPAEIVTITDQLDADLNWNSFALTEIGFGDPQIAVPKNSQHFETAIPVRNNGVDFEVQTEAGLRAETGVVYANFYSIVPGTGLPPDFPAGFLPPEDGTGCGMGYFAYTIKAKADAATGTEIHNIALITFDFASAIATNQVDPHDPSKGADPAKECHNTTDAGAPTGRVNALPATTPVKEPQVSWSGQDDAGGSGIASYDIYVSDNGGAYTVWLDDLTATSANFPRKDGHTYAFYSVAKDSVGHVEAAPTTPDAVTTVTGAQTVVAGTAGNDSIYVRIAPADPGLIEVFVNKASSGTPSATMGLGGTPALSIKALAGDDQITIDFGNGNPIPAGGLSVDGGDDRDSLTVVGLRTNDSLTINANQVLFGSSPINHVDTESVALGSADGGNILVGALMINGSTRLGVATTGRVLRTSSLSIVSDGVLDLADNDLILQATSGTRNAVFTTVSDLVKSARNTSPKWSGPGITSSTAWNNRAETTGLAVALNDRGEGQGQLFAEFGGIDVDANSVLVKYSWNGDLNLDRVVNADDYFLIDSAFLGQGPSLATKPRPVEAPAAKAADESGADTLVLRASQPNTGVFATREGNWLRDLLAGEESILGMAE